MAQVLVLGGGFGGVAAAHELRRLLQPDDEVVLVAGSDRFFVGFAKLWDLVGARELADGSARLSGLERHGIRYVQAQVEDVDPGRRTVRTTAGTVEADAIVVALGAGYAPGHTALLGPGAHNLYDAAALPDIRTDLARLEEGRLVVSILGGPYLCPPAPFEATLLLDEWLRAHGRREDVDLAVTTPQPMTLPVAGPDASRYLAERVEERGITLLTEHKVEDVDHAEGTLRFAGGSTLAWDLLLTVPAAVPHPVLAACPLAGPSGWIEPDPRTFATAFDRVYAVGDCTMVPTATAQLPKAGVFAEGGGRVAAANIAADLHGGDGAVFDGHGYCFLELPGHQVAKVEGDFYAEPRPEVALAAPSQEAFAAKQEWERDRLARWFA
jgi:sulfide:quinone oxidoreductase